MNNLERIDEMKARINAALNPSKLEIIDDSHAHVGHSGAQSGAGHFTVIIAAKQFDGKLPIDCHRMVYSALGDLLQTEIHAISIQIERE